MSFDTSFNWIAPGKVAFGERPGRWRDVQEDLKWLWDQGIRTILSLVEDETWLDDYNKAGFRAHHIPIDDFHAPTMQQIAEGMNQIAEGQPIYVHCRAGYGRAGTMAAAWLIHNGTAPIDAIRIVRRLRPGAVEVDAQFDALLEYAARIKP